MRARKARQFGIVQCVVAVGDLVAQRALGDGVTGCRQCGKGVGDDPAARLADAVAPVLVPRRVGPQIARAVHDRGDRRGRGQWRQMFGVSADDAPPLRLGRPEGDQNRVVEVEQDRARKVRHAVGRRTAQTISAGACGTVFQNSPSCPKKMRAPPLSSRRACRAKPASPCGHRRSAAVAIPCSVAAEIAGIGGIARHRPSRARTFKDWWPGCGRGSAGRPTAVAEQVVLAVDLNDFVPEVEVAPVEPAPRGMSGSIPASHSRCCTTIVAFGISAVTADMIEVEM